MIPFEAPVTAALFDGAGQAMFAGGDGRVRFEGGAETEAHEGAVLCAAAHPSGEGLVTGGDDGRIVWSRPDEEPQVLADLKGKWIDALAASPESGLIAAAAGRQALVLDAGDPHFRRTFEHERSVSDLAFDAKGRRLACATYGGVALWFARIETQKPIQLKWAGSHTLVALSPDGRFCVTAMQDNQLHGWTLPQGKDLRMGGYPAKIRSLSFCARGAVLATSGAHGVVCWPFTGGGPGGKEAAEIGHDDSALVVRCAGAADQPRIAAGLNDGRVWAADLRAVGLKPLRAEKGAAISALAMTSNGARVAWGDEDGLAGVGEVPA
ncbi:WD40 repeat domain-containing protein [Brevundimonas sp. 2R-24]|uniref:WD40 repeat domain-containing protein n=1 Tax=Peiella sedimenti TaxID=3061083 RepID=A0ABT8SL88_9CAUL|nr:WD40 repeat domain-containing protein [Caulobacteraceae bacterium XZ-24]